MATYTVKSSGGDFTTLNAALTAIANGTITDVAGHVIVLYTIGTEPTNYSYTGSGAGATRANHVTIRVATPAENGGTNLDLQITKAAGSGSTNGFLNVPRIRWDLRDSGKSRLRFRGYWYLKGGCHGWEFYGDPDETVSGPGHLDGDVWNGNLFIQYGFQSEKINDDVVFDGVKFIMRKSGITTGTRGYNNVGCLRINSPKQGTQARPSDNWLINNCEMAHYASDGMFIQGLSNSTVSNNHIHHLYPTVAGNGDHIDGMHITQMSDSQVINNTIHHVLYQGLWMKTDNTPTAYTADHDTYGALYNLVVANNIMHTFGGRYLHESGTAPDFNPLLTFVEPKDQSTRTYGPSAIDKSGVGGTGAGITNGKKVLFAHNIAVNQFSGAGLEVNATQAGQRPSWMTGTADLDVDIVNNVVSWAACDRSGGKVSVNPKALGTWRNNLQTTVLASYNDYEVVTVAGTGDLAIGTAPNWDANYVPFTGSPLLNAGYNSTLSTGLTLPAADRNGVTWGTRDIGGYETAGETAPLKADAGLDTGGVVSTAIQLDGSATTSPGTTTWSWSKVSGPGTVTFSSSTASTPTATCSLVGTYVIRLTASTVATPGTTDTDDVTVYVTAEPEPPEPSLVVAGLFSGGQVRLIDGVVYVKVIDPDTPVEN
jgi:hypothetical protein